MKRNTSRISLGHLFKKEADIPTAVEKKSRARITGIRSESIIFAQLRESGLH